MMVVDNREEVEGIIDPGSQIIAMSEAVCHDIGLAYDLSIKLNMQSANGKVNQSLGLAHNVPCKINSITLYLRIHIIQSLAYNILLG
jgi:predicted aspartyl protease